MKQIYSVKALQINVPTIIDIDDNIDWVKKILDEVNEEIDPSIREGRGNYLKLDIDMERQNDNTLGDYVLLEGDIKMSYTTNCVKTLEIMDEVFETEINAVVLENFLEKELNLEEETTFVVGSEEYDLYFYDRKLDLEPIIHEYIFLNKNPYPKLPDAEES